MNASPLTPDPTQPLTLRVGDLRPGDRLISLGGVGFAQMAADNAPPVLVADLRLPDEEDAPTQTAEALTKVCQITTSTGTLYAAADAPAQAHRYDDPRSVLLISRRRSLHSRLLAFGVPVRRRTPIDEETVPAVTAAEWDSAPLIVFDGYLAQETIRALWARGLSDRPCIAIVGDDPDDVRLDGRARACHARAQWVLPYNMESLSALLHAAVVTPETTPLDPFSFTSDPFLGILTAGE